ncbi:MAG TPA: hypothetical protein VMY35_10620 [Phycisphaerae bacterium]|nr:hypothetical protein [Phycisphaerae bacterium]
MSTIGKRFLVQKVTRTADLKPGDLVITAEVHRVAGPHEEGNKSDFRVADILPRCPTCKGRRCCHEHIMSAGRFGQQCILKIIDPDA